MFRNWPAVLLIFAGAQAARAQEFGEPVGAILKNTQAVSSSNAAKTCVTLPVLPPDDRLQGPHGDKLISTKCEVMEYHPAAHWSTALYRWNSVFTAEDKKRGPEARDAAQ